MSLLCQINVLHISVWPNITNVPPLSWGLTADGKCQVVVSVVQPPLNSYAEISCKPHPHTNTACLPVRPDAIEMLRGLMEEALCQKLYLAEEW